MDDNNAFFKPSNNPNTILIEALVLKNEASIKSIFAEFPPEHLIFNLRDRLSVAGNTPLGLPLKTGRYDLALRLIEEKKCDVNGMIGFDGAKILHKHLI